jgi:molybdopterin synthase sulfur carrier subunit
VRDLPAGALGRGADAVVIRVVLPHHLRTLAQDRPTQRTLLDALEASYPTLRGTIRDHGTTQRRDFIRFFACGRDITLDSADDPLPEEVASGAAVFGVVGAMAGG